VHLHYSGKVIEHRGSVPESLDLAVSVNLILVVRCDDFEDKHLLNRYIGHGYPLALECA
jgi:hypothetical protein